MSNSNIVFDTHPSISKSATETSILVKESDESLLISDDIKEAITKTLQTSLDRINEAKFISEVLYTWKELKREGKKHVHTLIKQEATGYLDKLKDVPQVNKENQKSIHQLEQENPYYQQHFSNKVLWERLMYQKSPFFLYLFSTYTIRTSGRIMVYFKLY